METHFDEHKSNYTILDPTMRFYWKVQNLSALTKA